MENTAKYRAILSSVSSLIKKASHFTDDEGETHNCFIFDLDDSDENFMDDLENDTFGDGKPDDLDFDEKIPFAFYGQIESDEDGNAFVAQPDGMLFLDIENGDETSCPVYAIDIDGTGIPETFRKIGEEIKDLKFQIGIVE